MFIAKMKKCNFNSIKLEPGFKPGLPGQILEKVAIKGKRDENFLKR
jgi:hypothetical protein